MPTTLALAAIAQLDAHTDAGTADADFRALLAARHDPSAFAPIYRRHYRTIVGYLYRRLGNAALAEDLAADTFIAALRAVHRYRPTGAPYRAFLLRTATNLANNHVRKTTRRRALPRAVERWHRDHAADLADAELARAALLSLPPHHQAVLSLHHVEGLSVEETAGVLGCRPGTVKSRLSRAREALRRELDRRSGHDA